MIPWTKYEANVLPSLVNWSHILLRHKGALKGIHILNAENENEKYFLFYALLTFVSFHLCQCDWCGSNPQSYDYDTSDLPQNTTNIKLMSCPYWLIEVIYFLGVRAHWKEFVFWMPKMKIRIIFYFTHCLLFVSFHLRWFEWQCPNPQSLDYDTSDLPQNTTNIKLMSCPYWLMESYTF